MLYSSKFNKQIWYEEEFNPELLPTLILWIEDIHK